MADDWKVFAFRFSWKLINYSLLDNYNYKKSLLKLDPFPVDSVWKNSQGFIISRRRLKAAFFIFREMNERERGRITKNEMNEGRIPNQKREVSLVWWKKSKWMTRYFANEPLLLIHLFSPFILFLFRCFLNGVMGFHAGLEKPWDCFVIHWKIEKFLVGQWNFRFVFQSLKSFWN